MSQDFHPVAGVLFAGDAPDRRPLLRRILRPALRAAARGAAAGHAQAGRVRARARRRRRLQAAELDDAADRDRGGRRRGRRAQAQGRGSAGDHAPRGRVRQRARDGRGRRPAGEGRRRAASAGAAGRRAGLVWRGLPPGASRMADRHGAGRPDVPRRGGRLDRGRDQAGGHDRRGRAALPLPRAHPARPGAGPLPRRARRPDGQAAGARARRVARAGVGGGRPRGAARRPRAGADAVRLMPDPVSTRREGEVLVITIERPEARNAINAAVAEGIGRALDTLDGDAALRAGVLTGAGGVFSAGMDLKAFVAGESPHYGDRGVAGIVRRPPEKPLIAAVEGWALAGGFEVALACDLIVASREARFGIPEVKRGLVAAGGGLLRLPSRIPYHLAMELALTGDPIDAERAAAVGLVSRVTAPGGALEEALGL